MGAAIPQLVRLEKISASVRRHDSRLLATGGGAFPCETASNSHPRQWAARIGTRKAKSLPMSRAREHTRLPGMRGQRGRAPPRLTRRPHNEAGAPS